MSVCDLCGNLGPRESEPAPPPAYCGACRGPFGACDCAATLLPAPANFERWAVLHALLTRSGTDPKVAARTAAEWLRGGV